MAMESWDDRRRRTESFPAICRGCSTRHRFRIYWKAVAGRVDGIRRELPGEGAGKLRGSAPRNPPTQISRVPRCADSLFRETREYINRGNISSDSWPTERRERSISATRDREILKNWKEEESQDRKICSCTR